MIIHPRKPATLILVAERLLNTVTVLERVTIPDDLDPSSSLVTETISRLHSQFDPLLIHLVLPQSETVSHRIKLQDHSIHEFIAEEIKRLKNIEGIEPVFDYQPLGKPSDPPEKQGHYWLTWCQRPALQQHLQAIGLSLESVHDIANTAQGLWSVFERSPSSRRATCIVEIDRNRTTLLQVQDSEPRQATSFSSPPFSENSLPNSEEMASWHRRLLQATSAQNDDASAQEKTTERCILVGEEPMIDHAAQYLRKREFAHSIQKEHPPDRVPSRFTVAYGVACAALGQTRLQISLLPPNLQHQQEKRRFWIRLRGWASALALLTLTLLVFGSWQKLSLLGYNQTLSKRYERAVDDYEDAERNLADFASHYERLRPVLKRQMDATELLKTLASLQSISEDESHWLVLFADFETYQNALSETTGTNQTQPGDNQTVTNQLSGHTGYVAELGFKDRDQIQSRVHSLVTRLNDDPVYRQVDTLPEDLRRSLANTNVLLPDRHVALSLKLFPNFFAAPSILNNTTSAPPSETRERNASSFNNRNERILNEGR